MGFFSKMFGSYSDRELKSIYPIVDKIEAMADKYKAMSDAELQAKTPEFKTRLQSGETLDDILPEAFATVREASRRVLGLYPYRVQLVGPWQPRWSAAALPCCWRHFRILITGR